MEVCQTRGRVAAGRAQDRRVPRVCRLSYVCVDCCVASYMTEEGSGEVAILFVSVAAGGFLLLVREKKKGRKARKNERRRQLESPPCAWGVHERERKKSRGKEGVARIQATSLSGGGKQLKDVDGCS